MSESCTGYLRRILPDTEEIGAMVREALEQPAMLRAYTLRETVARAQKLIQDLERAAAAAVEES